MRCFQQQTSYCGTSLRTAYTLLFAILYTSPGFQVGRFMKVWFVFCLTLALAWSISCCFSLVSVWICCSWACLSCSSCLRKASSHAFNLSTAELKTSKTEDYVNETIWNHQIPGQHRPQAFPGYLPFSKGKALGTRLIPRVSVLRTLLLLSRTWETGERRSRGWEKGDFKAPCA